MIKRFFLSLIVIIILLFAFVLTKTFIYSRQIPATSAAQVPALDNMAIVHLSNAIRIKTVSLAGDHPKDSSSFFAFRSFLDSAYPVIQQKLQKTVIDSFSYIYHWKGKNSQLAPYLFLAHTDVVPVEDSSAHLWHVEPFAGTIKDSAVWGRGATDDKCSVIALMEAVQVLLTQNYQPERDIYLCFGHDEELGGIYGAQKIVQWFKERNIKAALVLDEGGIITKENFKELNRPIALLGVTEKGYATFELSVEKAGGHSSMPEKETAIDILIAALNRLKQHPTKVRFAEPTNVMLDKIGPGLNFTTRMALANRWLFEPMLVSQFEKTKGTNASIHTTIVPTILSAGMKDNVIPSFAKATVNCRIMPGETSASVEAFIKTAINDDRIHLNRGQFASEPGKPTSLESEAYKKAIASAYKILDNIVPTPFLMIGATDSRFYEPVTDATIRFLPAIDPQGYHGVDERLPFADLQRMIFFYQLMMRN
ncbi:M20/M25/M40 family metallo-hydrolase [Danxiaibacter flavus]|uniref:M20/M25/M40 family metallo-hydrolase n=1 Tax=Danxiaibacter flavus TaxID=3049108 RepID=A0ABV3Z8W2_9BACT|nr:M20/M25/M40 family metallo-hydrolase [Chitinophagaceae bacterium DXS]